MGQGRENAKQFLADNPEVASTIERSIRENAGLIAESLLDGKAGITEEHDEDGVIKEVAATK